MRLYKDDIEKIRTLDSEAAWQFYLEKEHEWQESTTYQGTKGNSLNASAFITWGIALQIQNDYDTYHTVRDIVLRHGQENKWNAIDAIKEWVEESFIDPVLENLHGIPSDLLTSAFSEINWREIYEDFEIDWADDETVAVGLSGDDESEEDADDAGAESEEG